MRDSDEVGIIIEPHDDDLVVAGRSKSYGNSTSAAGEYDIRLGTGLALGLGAVAFALLCAMSDARAQDADADPRPEEPAYENEGGLRDTMRELAAEDRAAHEEEVAELTLLCLPPHGRICRPAAPPAAVASTPE